MAEIDAHVEQITVTLTRPETEGIVLTGSYVRGDATRHSDLDFDVYVAETEDRPRGPRLFYSGSYLVSIVTTTIEETRSAFRDPSQAIFAIPGIRNARILFDRNGSLALLKREAEAFCWEPLQADADRYAGRKLVKDAEGIHKLLGTLSTGQDAGTAYVMAWLIRGTTDALAVHRGLMIPSVNQYFHLVEEAMGLDSVWTRAHRRALGIGEALPLHERARATLELYAETARVLSSILTEEEREVVDGVVGLICSS